MAVRVRLTPEGEAPKLDVPVKLFATSLGTAAQLGDYRPQYAVSSDGRRFLLAIPAEPANVPITVILNWRR